MRKFLTICLATAAWQAQAQTINLHGSVTTKAGKPVPNAIVVLQGKGLKDTTGSDGAYSIVQNGSSSIQTGDHRFEGISVEGNDLVVTLDHPASIRLEQIDLNGKLLQKEDLEYRGSAGERFGWTPSSRARGVFLLRVVADGQSTTFQCFTLGAGEAKVLGAARAAATVDTLVASATGFASAKLPLSSYEQTADIVLDSASTVVRSAGCDKTRTLANGTITIQSGGKSRKYILGAPATYDKSQAYRLVVAYAESGSSAQSVATRNYFRMAGYDPKNTIFVAPDAENGAGSWAKTDVDFTDAILAQVEGDLCIDKSRVFATGFSFGGAMSIAIACTRADVFRGVAFFSGADLTGSCPTTLTKPIAYYASQASGDASGTPTPTSGRTKQAEFAKVNGCTAEPNAIVFPATGKAHTCTIYKNCSAGHPTVYCVFDGPHGWEPVDPGQSTSWDPPEAWKFITQF